MADARWSTETEELVARALERPCVCHFVDIGVGLQKAAEDPTCPRCTLFGQTTAILADLADAGVLTPVGGETRHERSYSHEWDGSDCVGPEGGCDDGVLVQRTVTEWPDGTELITPWREVTHDD